MPPHDSTAPTLAPPASTTPGRALLALDPAAALARLTGMGRIMVIAVSGPATHERIGHVETVTRDGDVVHLGGTDHAARVRLAPLDRVVADRTVMMKDRPLPRLEFQDTAGVALFRAVALDGLAPFEAGIADVAWSAAAPGPARAAGVETTLPDDDPAYAPFRAAIAADRALTITLETPALTQTWTGTLAELMPAMGYLNIIRKDFHLHLAGGAVSGWQAEATAAGERLIALDRDGRDFGLSVVTL